MERIGRFTTPRMAASLIVRHPLTWSVGIALTVTVVVLGLHSAVGDANIALFYLLGVLLCAATVGLRPALLCAILSVVAYNFFFVEPVHTLHVAYPQDMLRLLLFLIAALIGGGLTAQVRERAAVAQQRAHETAALYTLSQAISVQLDFAQVAPLLLRTTIDLLQSAAATILIPDRFGVFQEVARVGRWPAKPVVVEAPLQASAPDLGLLRVVLPAARLPLPLDQQRLLETLASQAGLALQRSQLASAAAHAEALAESDRLKSVLLSSVSHDFRTPLSAITAAADELLSEDVHWSEAARRNFASVIWNQANRLNYLVTNLLDLTRIEAGALRSNIGWYSLAEIIEQALGRLEDELEGRPVVVDVPDTLPLIPLDYVQIEQVLWNVLHNALKYSPPSTPIRISVREESDALQLDVADEGRGIPPEERERVFEKFYRVQRSDQGKVDGMGIGLAICKGLIDAHHGTIVIDARPGGGTIVHITLPREQPYRQGGAA